MEGREEKVCLMLVADAGCPLSPYNTLGLIQGADGMRWRGLLEGREVR